MDGQDPPSQGFGAAGGQDKAWWKRAGRCSRCGEKVAVYQFVLAPGAGYVAVCGGCLSEAEVKRLAEMPVGEEKAGAGESNMDEED